MKCGPIIKTYELITMFIVVAWEIKNVQKTCQLSDCCATTFFIPALDLYPLKNSVQAPYTLSHLWTIATHINITMNMKMTIHYERPFERNCHFYIFIILSESVGAAVVF